MRSLADQGSAFVSGRLAGLGILDLDHIGRQGPHRHIIQRARIIRVSTSAENTVSNGAAGQGQPVNHHRNAAAGVKKDT